MAKDGNELGRPALTQLNHLLRWKRTLPVARAPAQRRQQHFTQSSTGIAIINNAGANIPAFACMKIGTPTTVDGELVIPVSKPDSTFCRFYLINGPDIIQYGATAYAAGFFADLPFRALYDTADGTPSFGQWWGPYPSSWKLRRHMYGFRIIGDPNTTQSGAEHVRCTQHLVMDIFGKTDGSASKGGTATISVWKGNASADSGANVDSAVNPYAATGSGKWGEVCWHSETPRFRALEC